MPVILVVGRPDAPDPHDLAPLLAVLSARGHRVVLLGTEEHRAVASERAVAFRLLPPVPERGPARGRSRIDELRDLFRSLLIDSLAAHWRTVERVVEEERPDLVLTDALCFAACMLAELPRAERPPVVVLGTIPPPHARPDAAPYGLGMPPDESSVNRLRNRLLHLVMRRLILRPVLPELHARFRELTGRTMSRDSYEAASKAEVWAQCALDRFEYPNPSAANLRLVGPLSAVRAAALPPWWAEAHQHPVVHTRATRDVPLDRLVVPLIEALEGASISLVVAGAGAAAVEAALGRPLPDTVHVAETLPASMAISHRGVAVLRGNFVHAQHALQQGLPVIVFGTGAEEAETGARLAWHGCGVRLATDRPTPAALRDAVQHVLATPGYRRAAARIAVQTDRADAEGAIADLVESLAPSGG